MFKMFGFEYLRNFLREEGYKVNDEDGHFSFKYQGTVYIAFKNESPYLQIIVICNTKDYPRERMLELCNQLNGDKFVIKFIAMDDTVWCSYEFLPSEHTTNEDFDRTMVLLDKASDELFERLSK